MSNNNVNTPNRYELFVLEDGEQPVEVTEDTKIPNAATVRVAKQDHTLGNLLRAQLLTSPKIFFAGYQVPHPLQPYFLLKIQTDGSQTPQEALEEACKQLVAGIATLENKFKREFSFRDVDAPGASVTAGTGLEADAYGGQATGQGGQGWASGRDYLDL